MALLVTTAKTASPFEAACPKIVTHSIEPAMSS
jgi:hypothetical protein